MRHAARSGRGSTRSSTAHVRVVSQDGDLLRHLTLDPDRDSGLRDREERLSAPTRTAIQLAGSCHAAYQKARASIRRRFNDAVLEAVYITDRKIGRAEFRMSSRLSSSARARKGLKLDLTGRYSNSWRNLARVFEEFSEGGRRSRDVVPGVRATISDHRRSRR